jgi:hypothetical protein
LIFLIIIFKDYERENKNELRPLDRVFIIIFGS